MAERHPKVELHKIQSGKQIKAGGDVMAYLLNGDLFWTPAAKRYLDQDTMQEMKSFAEN